MSEKKWKSGDGIKRYRTNAFLPEDDTIKPAEEIVPIPVAIPSDSGEEKEILGAIPLPEEESAKEPMKERFTKAFRKRSSGLFKSAESEENESSESESAENESLKEEPLKQERPEQPKKKKSEEAEQPKEPKQKKVKTEKTAEGNPPIFAIGLIVLILVGLALGFLGGNMYVKSSAEYTVTFDANGGENAPSAQNVKSGAAVTEPTSEPTLKGMSFSGWYTDKDGKDKYEFSAKVKKNITLYAGWKKGETAAAAGGTAGSVLAADATKNGTLGQLVNRTYPIEKAESYRPDDLTACDYAYGDTQYLRKEAATAMDSMVMACKTATGGKLYTKSGFRDYDVQDSLYENQINRRDSEEEAATISAVPGTSEHELGLAMDLTIDGSLEASFGETTQGIWLIKHCTEYGFIHRYPAGSEEITGIIYEPWHFRYVGKDIAQDMAAQGIDTLEEYYGLYLDSEDIDPYLSYLK